MSTRTSFPAARPADTTELVETVRAALERPDIVMDDGRRQAAHGLAALDLLAAAARRNEQAERERANMLPHDEVCACLSETGSRRVTPYIQCHRCKAFMDGDYLILDRDLATERADAAIARVRDLEAFAHWIIAMDDPEDVLALQERRTVTMTTIIDRARAALVSGAAEGNSDE